MKHAGDGVGVKPDRVRVEEPRREIEEEISLVRLDVVGGHRREVHVSFGHSRGGRAWVSPVRRGRWRRIGAGVRWCDITASRGSRRRRERRNAPTGGAGGRTGTWGRAKGIGRGVDGVLGRRRGNGTSGGRMDSAGRRRESAKVGRGRLGGPRSRQGRCRGSRVVGRHVPCRVGGDGRCVDCTAFPRG